MDAPALPITQPHPKARAQSPATCAHALGPLRADVPRRPRHTAPKPPRHSPSRGPARVRRAHAPATRSLLPPQPPLVPPKPPHGPVLLRSPPARRHTAPRPTQSPPRLSRPRRIPSGFPPLGHVTPARGGVRRRGARRRRRVPAILRGRRADLPPKPSPRPRRLRLPPHPRRRPRFRLGLRPAERASRWTRPPFRGGAWQPDTSLPDYGPLLHTIPAPLRRSHKLPPPAHATPSRQRRRHPALLRLAQIHSPQHPAPDRPPRARVPAVRPGLDPLHALDEGRRARARAPAHAHAARTRARGGPRPARRPARASGRGPRLRRRARRPPGARSAARAVEQRPPCLAPRVLAPDPRDGVLPAAPHARAVERAVPAPARVHARRGLSGRPFGGGMGGLEHQHGLRLSALADAWTGRRASAAAAATETDFSAADGGRVERGGRGGRARA
ncbi:hypothetical protein OF83DRAFT_1141854 [Amylostereum chailletii]|nr:hypothetical protein OF83DRAFT_1141854 [Amylostereum chailletii]